MSRITMKHRDVRKHPRRIRLITILTDRFSPYPMNAMISRQSDHITAESQEVEVTARDRLNRFHPPVSHSHIPPEVKGQRLYGFDEKNKEWNYSQKPKIP